MNKLLLLLSVFVFFTTGCSSIAKKQDAHDPNAHSEETTDHWRARGKFSYRSSETTESGNFDWRQEGENYRLRLYGPLGLGTVKISGGPNLVRIQSRDQDISSDQPLNLLYRMTGFEIPLNSMPMWLLGKPASRSPSDVTLDDRSHIQSFSERKWRLNYSNFEEFDNQQVPTTINAYKDGINLRMLVYNWAAK